MKKNGFINQTVGGVVTLIVGTAVATLTLIFTGVLGGQTYNLAETDINSISNNAIVNQSLTLLGTTSQSFGHTYVQSGTLSVLNASKAVGLGNFTLNYDAGTVALSSGGAAYNNTALDFSYTYGDLQIRTYVTDSIKSSFKAQAQVGNYMPLIVLAIVITLIMALILSMTALGGDMGGNRSAL